jgi:hypothetical protein
MKEFQLASETKKELQKSLQELIDNIEFKDGMAIMIFGEIHDCVCESIEHIVHSDNP